MHRKQWAILGFVSQYGGQHGRAPTIRELGAGTGISSTSLTTFHVRRLESMGYLEREPGLARSLKLTDKAMALLGPAAAPRPAALAAVGINVT